MNILRYENFLQDHHLGALREELAWIEAQDAWTKKFVRAGSEMYEYNHLDHGTPLHSLMTAITSHSWLENIERLLETPPLLTDPYLVGAGYSMICAGGDLKWHIDFNWNDRIKMYREATIIAYIDQPESGGELEFDDGQVIEPKEGTLVVFPHSETIRHRVRPVVGKRTAVRFFLYSSRQQPPANYHRSLYGVDSDGNPTDVKD